MSFDLRRGFVSALLLFSLVWLCPCRAGTPYAQAAGNPPVCTSLQWQAWYQKLLNFRLAECPVNRPSSYFFAQSGSDSTGNGSQGNPWKSIAKAQAVLNASPGNIALLFKRGDTWKETATYTFPILTGATPGSSSVTVATNYSASSPTVGQSATLTGGAPEQAAIRSYALVNGVETFSFTTPQMNSGHTGVQFTLLSNLYVTQPNVTVGAWGPGTQKPVFSAFFDALPHNLFVSAATRGDRLNRAWSQVDPNPVGWVREVNDVSVIYRRLLSASQVDATPGSWFQDPATHVVYIHAPDDVALKATNRNFEAAVVNNVSGVYVGNVDGTRVDSLRVDGYGCALNNALDSSGARAYGIKGDVEGSNACVVSSCECYFNHNHGIGILSNAGGGIVTYFGCRTGWNTAGDTPFVSFAQNGGEECILHECECPGVVTPAGLQLYAFPQSVSSHGFTQHTGQVLNTSHYLPGQPTITIFGSPANTPFQSGLAVTLLGPAPETLTVQNYNAATGQLTFTSNIANAGHSGFAYVSGPYSGGFVSYAASLCVLYGCRNKPGPYQETGVFGGGQSVPAWSDLAGCRSWDVGEQFFVRTPMAIDANALTSVLSSAAQTAGSVTLTSPNSGNAVPQSSGWVTLSGGPSGPEAIQVSGYRSGVVSFATPILGAGRTAIQYNVGPNAAKPQADFNPILASPYTAIINGRFEGGETYSSPANGDTSLAGSAPGSSSVFLNCTFITDWSNVSSATVPRYRSILSLPPTASGFSAYNCRFHFRLAADDTGGLEYNALKNDVPTQIKVYNSIFSGEFAEGAAAVGTGNDPSALINNAYSGISIKTGTAGYDQDPYFVELSHTPLFGHPEPASPLLSANTQKVLGQYPLEYDADWMPRSTSEAAIGPYEPLNAP